MKEILVLSSINELNEIYNVHGLFHRSKLKTFRKSHLKLFAKIHTNYTRSSKDVQIGEMFYLTERNDGLASFQLFAYDTLV